MADTAAYKRIDIALVVYSYDNTPTPNYTVSINGNSLGSYFGCNGACGKACAYKNYQWYRGGALDLGVYWNGSSSNNMSSIVYGGSNTFSITRSSSINCAYGMAMEFWYRTCSPTACGNWVGPALVYDTNSPYSMTLTFGTPNPC